MAGVDFTDSLSGVHIRALTERLGDPEWVQMGSSRMTQTKTWLNRIYSKGSGFDCGSPGCLFRGSPNWWLSFWFPFDTPKQVQLQKTRTQLRL